MKKRIFIDMDGTLAEYKKFEGIEAFFVSGYFLNLQPLQNVVDGVKTFIKKNPDIDVYTLSACFKDTNAIEEKNLWLDKYLPEIDKEHRIYTECNKPKERYLPDGPHITDYLLDDFTKNLNEWSGRGIKLLNGVNCTMRSWNGCQLCYTDSPDIIADSLTDIVQKNKLIRDEKPDIQLRKEGKEFIYVPEDVLTDILSNYYKKFTLKKFLSEYQDNDVDFIKIIAGPEAKVETQSIDKIIADVISKKSEKNTNEMIQGKKIKQPNINLNRE